MRRAGLWVQLAGAAACLAAARFFVGVSVASPIELPANALHDAQRVTRAFSDPTVKLSRRDLVAYFIAHRVDYFSAEMDLPEIDNDPELSLVCSFKFVKLDSGVRCEPCIARSWSWDEGGTWSRVSGFGGGAA